MERPKFNDIVLAGLCWGWTIWILVFHSYEESGVLVALKNWNIPKYLIDSWLVLAGIGLLLPSHKWRKQVHLLMAAFWFFIAFAIMETNFTLTAIPVYVTIAILHAGNGLSK